MKDIIVIEGEALTTLLEDLGLEPLEANIYKISVADDEGYVKTKVNEDMWTAGVLTAAREGGG